VVAVPGLNISALMALLMAHVPSNLCHNTNLISPAPALAAITLFSPLAFNINNQSNDSVEPAMHPCIGSAACCNALGWTKCKSHL